MEATVTVPVFQAPGGAPVTPTVYRKPPLPPIGKLVAFDGDRMVLTHPAAKAKLNRSRLSHSTAEAIGSCAGRWAAEKLIPSDEDPFGAAPLGTAAHAVLEDLFALPSAERTTARAFSLIEGLETRHKLADPPPAELERWRSEIALRVTGLWTIEDPTKVVVASRELSLNDVEVAGVPFVGFIDRVDMVPGIDVVADMPDNEALSRMGQKVVDYKAGKVKKQYANSKFGDSHGDQLREYAMAIAAKNNGRMPKSAEVYYIRHGVSRVIPLDPGAMDKTARAFAAAWVSFRAHMDEEVLPLRSSPLCGWCPLAQVCPVAVRDGKTEAKVDSAAHGVSLGIPVLRPLALTTTGTDVVGAGSGAVPAVADDFANDMAALDGDITETLVGAGDPASPSSSSTTRPDRPTESQHSKGNTVTLIEDKPWEETSGPNRGLNPNSYAATAVFGMVAMAVDELYKAEQTVNGPSVRGLAQTFQYIVSQAQSDVADSISLQDGINTRIRGALHTTIETLPMPWNGDANDWQEWTERAIKRVLAICKTAIHIWETGPVSEPWVAMGDFGGSERSAA